MFLVANSVVMDFFRWVGIFEHLFLEEYVELNSKIS